MQTETLQQLMDVVHDVGSRPMLHADPTLLQRTKERLLEVVKERILAVAMEEDASKTLNERSSEAQSLGQALLTLSDKKLEVEKVLLRVGREGGLAQRSRDNAGFRCR